MSSTIVLADLAATERLGARLAGILRRGDVVALYGDLGAGKTALARAIVRAAAGDAELPVPSPTFTLVETYETPIGSIWHFDLYRLSTPDDVWELGLEEALAEGITLLEWPQKLKGLLPASRLELCLAIVRDSEARVVELAGIGNWQSRLATLEAA